MQRFVTLALIAIGATLPALVLRFAGWYPNPLLDTALFGIAILAAGFLLSWGAESASERIAQGLILALVALVTVLPEYAVDIYYAYKAGLAGPGSEYAQYAAANMTGANRLLVGVAWPLMVLIHWAKDRHRTIDLGPQAAIEISFLLLASAYCFVILLKRSISAFDFLVLFAIFAAYIWRVRNVQKVANTREIAEPGPAQALKRLSPAAQWWVSGGLIGVAAAVILLSAEPFAEAMIGTGRAIGLNEFLLIQWLAPLASEAPAITVAILFVMANRSDDGLTAMISDKINQWTLLVGMLPLALSVGAGALNMLPLNARQEEEFFLTAAQSLFAIGLLLKLRLSVRGGLALIGLFGLQVTLATIYRNDEARTITTLTWLAWAYLVFAAILFAINARALVAIVRTGLIEKSSRVETVTSREGAAT